jgi:hypothetical protein
MRGKARFFIEPVLSQRTRFFAVLRMTKDSEVAEQEGRAEKLRR